jgi:transposase
MKRGTQVINGIEYVFEDHPYWDSDRKRGAHKRVYVGKNIDGVFVPNKKYLLEQELKEAKNQLKPGPKPTLESIRKFYGAVYLLERIGEITGVTDDLKQCFPDIYQPMLSIVYYLILESTPFYRFNKWHLTHRHPYDKNIASQRSSELLAGIDESQKMKFFTLQAKRRLEKEFLAFDTTSISSYSQLIKQVKYGKNKEGDARPQINLALLLGESSGLPAYYRKLPGNVSDVKLMRQLIKDLSFLSIDHVKLVLDRGFYSAENIDHLYKNHHKFLIGAKLSLSLVKNKLDDVRDSLKSRNNYVSEAALFAQSFLDSWPYRNIKSRTGEIIKEQRRLYIHCYYNDQKATDERMRFYHMLDRLEEDLRTGNKKPEHEAQYKKYFTVSETPKRGIRIEANQKAVDHAEKNFGYFALLSNNIKDAMEALRIYRTKDVIEKAFGNLKERLNMRRESVASEEALEGKLFIQFIALIHVCYIKKVMDEKKLFAKYSMDTLLDELDIIEFYQHPGCRHSVGEITLKQKQIFEAMGVALPT